ncbi:MAG: hypothetical protein HWD61_12555 [Parachlamydiaceae bacterium]|nr:MAG: hypothetical protein HWD61_12555 [Parachlamydiaceae bacterium]
MPRELTAEEIDAIVQQFQIDFTAEELANLQTFGMTAMETSEQRINELTAAYKNRQPLMPAAHYYDLKIL